MQEGDTRNFHGATGELDGAPDSRPGSTSQASPWTRALQGENHPEELMPTRV